MGLMQSSFNIYLKFFWDSDLMRRLHFIQLSLESSDGSNCHQILPALMSLEYADRHALYNLDFKYRFFFVVGFFLFCFNWKTLKTKLITGLLAFIHLMDMLDE